VATVQRKDKLERKWKGPQRGTKVIKDKIFEVEHLLSGVGKEVHSAKLVYFEDSEIDSQVKEEILL
jgi:hypothetical protein